jgi:hypothetical protein
MEQEPKMKDTYTNITETHMAEKDPAYDKIKARQEKSEHAKNVLRGAGYARGGGVSPVKAVHKHEKHLHKGKTETKFKHGGKIEGKKPHARADKFARGGSVPHGKHTKIAINIGGGQAEKQQAMQAGVQLGAKMAAAKMAGGPRPGAGAAMQARPMPAPGGPGPGPGMPAPGGAPGMPGAKHGGRMYKEGGKVGSAKVSGTAHITGGAGGGLGRLEKIKQYGVKK